MPHEPSFRWYARPVLFVSDVERWLRLYVDQLAFGERWRHEDAGTLLVAKVDRRGCELILSSRAAMARRLVEKLFAPSALGVSALLAACSSPSSSPGVTRTPDSGAIGADAAGEGADASTGGADATSIATDSGAGGHADGDAAQETYADGDTDADANLSAATPVYPAPGQMTGPGVLPPKVASTTYEGTLQYDNPAIVRDLGFSGVVNGQIVWTFGDTLLLTDGGSIFTASDSAALGDLATPTHVHDKDLGAGGGPEEWIPLDATEVANGGLGQYGEGGTNVVEYAPNKGLVWFLKNDRGSGGTGIVGAGVATVTADANGPVATRTDDTMWNPYEPYWGDIGVTYNPLDGDVYVFGHGPSSAQLMSNVYLAKVPAASATDVGAYQYWDQLTMSWTTTRLSNGALGTINVSSAQAIFTNSSHGQSNPFWSNYYDTWMSVYGADVGYTDVMVMTAPQLEGPWTTGFTIASTCPTTCSAIRYAIAPHPEYDLSGKTLLVTWTDSNTIYPVLIEWE